MRGRRSVFESYIDRIRDMAGSGSTYQEIADTLKSEMGRDFNIESLKYFCKKHEIKVQNNLQKDTYDRDLKRLFGTTQNIEDWKAVCEKFQKVVWVRRGGQRLLIR